MNLRMFKPGCFYALMAMLFVGCQQEKLDTLPDSGDVGYLQLSLELDVSSEGGRTEAVNTDNWNVIVYYESTTEVFNFANFTDVPSEIELTPGDYTVFVSSEDESVAFDNPFYTGTSDVVTINSGDVVPVTVNASLANVEVSVSYSPEVLADFTTMSTTITSTSGTIVYGVGETRSAYFVPGEDLSISADLTFTNPDLTTEVRTVTGTILGTAAQEHYQITVDYTLNGAISPLTITVDETTNDLPLTISEFPTFASNYGGSQGDEAFWIEATIDGGYIITGNSLSGDGDLSGLPGGRTGWIAKTDKAGEIEWVNNYGGVSSENLLSIKSTSDGGYIVVGSSNSADIPGYQGAGSFDGWILKLNATGTVEWQSAVGGTGTENFYEVVQTSDGGFAAAGHSGSSDGDVALNQGSTDFFLAKFDAAGNLTWNRTYGGTNGETAYGLKETSDGGFILSGESESSDGDVGVNQGEEDFWSVRTDSNGNIIWATSLGSTSQDEAEAVALSTDGGYYVAGYSRGNNGDVGGNRGGRDYWVVKLDDTGSIVWESNYGGSGNDYADAVEATLDGGLIVTGRSTSSNGDLTGNHGSFDVWTIKIDGSGNLLWQQNHGGSATDQAYSIIPLPNGSFAIAGTTQSADVDFTSSNGGSDAFILVIDENGNL